MIGNLSASTCRAGLSVGDNLVHIVNCLVNRSKGQQECSMTEDKLELRVNATRGKTWIHPALEVYYILFATTQVDTLQSQGISHTLKVNNWTDRVVIKFFSDKTLLPRNGSYLPNTLSPLTKRAYWPETAQRLTTKPGMFQIHRDPVQLEGVCEIKKPI
jgi:hypothetical protein